MLPFLWLVHMFIWLPSTTFATPRCLEQTSYWNCASLNLNKVPSALSKFITELDLSFNELQVIRMDDFRDYTQLESLTLNNNRIKVIQEQALFPLTCLEKLDLSFNRLDNLDMKWFKKLVSLQYLNLVGNAYKTIGQGNLFQPLKRLKNLHLGGPFLQSINENDLSGVDGLEELVLHGEDLQVYIPGSLKKIGPIKQITLGLNGPFQKDLALVECIISDVSHPNTTIIFSDTRFYQVNQVTPISIAGIKGVREMILRNVNVTERAFSALINCLSHSNLTFFAAEDIAFYFTGFWEPITPYMPHLEEVFLKNINIPEFYNFPALIFLSPIIKLLKRLSVINTRLYATPCQTSADLSLLVYMDLTGNLFNHWTLSEMMCDGSTVFQSLQTINISRNNLKSVNSQLFTNMTNLINIDMSGNHIHSMPETCSWPPFLQLLNLSSSLLTKATACLPASLHVLDLSNNDLSTFDIELPLLRELYISGNKILMLPDGGFYPALVSLFIQNNALQTFSNADLKAYSMLKSLKAGGVSYVCSCHLTAFFSDMTGHNVPMADGYESYICASPDAVRGKRILDSRPSVLDCHKALALSIICSCILILLLLIAGLCHRFSVIWYMRMTWAWLRAKRKPVLKKGNLRYDAFVSYSERDSGWVEGYLVPELEHSHPPLQLCLHKRDFLLGGWILDNIMDAIEQSHRTLFVLSQHFVESEWCKYELDYSYFRLFDQNQDTAVLILLEPIAKKMIPKWFSKLRKFMNSRTYLEWPNDDSQTPRFWQSLREAIKRPED